jgi:hypothetical protein
MRGFASFSSCQARRLTSAFAFLASTGLVACGGGSVSTSSGSGTLGVALTDAPACGFDTVSVTIQGVLMAGQTVTTNFTFP